MLFLRDRFGISASEALYAMPAWEYRLLAAGLPESNVTASPRADPMSAVPKELEALG